MLDPFAVTLLRDDNVWIGTRALTTIDCLVEHFRKLSKSNNIDKLDDAIRSNNMKNEDIVYRSASRQESQLK